MKTDEKRKYDFLQTFTALSDSCSPLTKLNYVNEYFEATNGHFACRISEAHLPTVEKKPAIIFPNIEKLIAQAVSEPKDVELNNLKPTTEQLKLLTVKAGELFTCPKCHGNGSLICDLDHEHDCEDCNESGKVEATPEVDYVQALGKYWDYKYFGALFTAADLFGNKCFFKTDEASRMYLFTFDGAEIAIMPLVATDPFPTEYIILGES